MNPDAPNITEGLQVQLHTQFFNFLNAAMLL